MGEITVLLSRSQAGDDAAREQLYGLLYGELKRLARSHLSHSGPITLDPTAIVHEAWMRWDGGAPSGNRKQFFGYASTVMRSVIVDHVRERRADKRGAGLAPLTLSTAAFEALPQAPDAVALDDALAALGQADARALRVVEMRFFAGLTMDEIAEVLAVSVPTLQRDWRHARAFLLAQLSA